MADNEQLVCANHPERKGTHTCKKCGKKICFDCVSVSFGSYVCEECDPDLSVTQKQDYDDAQPMKQEKEKKWEGLSGLPIPKFAKWLIGFLLIMFLGGLIFVYTFDPPHGKLSIYRVAYYPVKSAGKTISKLLEEKGILAEWKFMENKLTSDGGYFVYFGSPEIAGATPVWYVKDKTTFTINEDSRIFCNSEISNTTAFSEKGLQEEDILNYIYGGSKR